MALGQLVHPTAFVDIIGTYRVGGREIAVLVGGALIVGELVAGVGYLVRSPARRRMASTVGVAVAAAWTMLGLQAFARGLVLDNCGCFGVYLAQPLQWWILIEDAEILAGTMWVFHVLHRQRP